MPITKQQLEVNNTVQVFNPYNNMLIDSVENEIAECIYFNDKQELIRKSFPLEDLIFISE